MKFEPVTCAQPKISGQIVLAFVAKEMVEEVNFQRLVEIIRLFRPVQKFSRKCSTTLLKRLTRSASFLKSLLLELLLKSLLSLSFF